MDEYRFLIYRAVDDESYDIAASLGCLTEKIVKFVLALTFLFAILFMF